VGVRLGRSALPRPADDKQVLQNLKRILAKVQEMRDQRTSLEQQLREMIQKDDITTSLVTTDRSEMKVGANRCGVGGEAPSRATRPGQGDSERSAPSPPSPEPPRSPAAPQILPSLGRNSLRSS